MTSNLELPHRFPFRFVDRLEPIEPVASVDAGEETAQEAGRESDASRRVTGTVRLAPTVGARLEQAVRIAGARPWSLPLAVEIMAQAAMVLLPRGEDDPDGEAVGYLAGVDGAELHADPVPGVVLRVEADIAGRFGPMIKARCRLVTRDEGAPVAEARLLVKLGA